MTSRYDFSFSRQHLPEVCKYPSPQRKRALAILKRGRRRPSKEEGAGKTGCALHPRSRVQMHIKKAHTSIQVQRKQSGLPCAMALRLTPRSPRRPAIRFTHLENRLRNRHLTDPRSQKRFVRNQSTSVDKTHIFPRAQSLPARCVHQIAGDRAFLPPSPTNCFVDLTPASGRQDHTASPYATPVFAKRLRRARHRSSAQKCTSMPSRPSHPASRFVTTAHTPLL
jgi:hypothetical protein